MNLKFWEKFFSKCPSCNYLVPINRKIYYAIIILDTILLSILLLMILITAPMVKLYLLSFSIHPSEHLAELARNVTAPCRTETTWNSCEEDLILRFVYNISWQSDEWYEEFFLMWNDPDSTLERGGDCENLAILSISMLKSLNPEKHYWLVSQMGHACFMARIENQQSHSSYYKFFNCGSTDMNAVLVV